jgi:hypothetical protein
MRGLNRYGGRVGDHSKMIRKKKKVNLEISVCARN